MGSDPQSYLQAMHELEHRECKKRIAELEAAACEARTSLGAAIAQSLADQERRNQMSDDAREMQPETVYPVENAYRMVPIGEALDPDAMRRDRDAQLQGQEYYRLEMLARDRKLEQAERRCAELAAALEPMKAACDEFIRKVECGEALSRRSYRQMKDAVNANDHAAILLAHDAQVERETLERVWRVRPQIPCCPEWAHAIRAEFAPKEETCADPTAPVASCVTCGKPVHTCERKQSVNNDYCCPLHTDGVELAGGRWICSEACAPKGESDERD